MHSLRIMLAAAGTVVLVACGGSDSESSPAAMTEPSATPSNNRPADDGVSLLHGTWQTEPLSMRDVQATLRENGLSRWIDVFLSVSPMKDGTVLTLELKGRAWNLYGKSQGQPSQKIDYDAEYVIRGNQLDVIHQSGATTYRWSLKGDILRLKWLATSQTPFNGIPDEVFQTALYMTEDFTRST